MKRLATIVVLLMLLFNWIGFQLFTAVADQSATQTSMEKPDQTDLMESGLLPYNVPGFHIATYPKVLDFDDLFEFEALQNFSTNEISLSISNDLFPDHAKDNQRISFKRFNGEYYSGLDRLFIKYPGSYLSGETPDRYLLIIPVIFLSPKDHPPQYIG
jgi:hypothetical protein